MNNEVQTPVIPGYPIELRVIEFNGKSVFETEFVFYDAELRAYDLRERGIDEDNFVALNEFDCDYHNGLTDFRSVRIFHPAQGEPISLKCGDRVRAIIQSSYIANQPTKDGRRKLHITVSNIRRIYSWMRHRDADDNLVIALLCGTREIKKKIIPFTIKKGIRAENGWAYPIVAQILPNGSILTIFCDTTRPVVTTGDYRLAQRQRHRTMQDIDKDFIIVPKHDRLLPTRYLRRPHYGTPHHL